MEGATAAAMISSLIDDLRAAVAARHDDVGDGDAGLRTFDGSLVGAATAAAIRSSLAASQSTPLDFSTGLGGGLRSNLAGRVTIPDDLSGTLETALAVHANVTGAGRPVELHLHQDFRGHDAGSVKALFRNPDFKSEHNRLLKDAVRKALGRV
jgi:hypothetical protein